MEMNETQSVLFKAAHVLRTRGWSQGEFQQSDGSCCALGAISIAAGLPPYMGHGWAEEAMERALCDLGLKTSIAIWNDKPRRTANEVITVLEYAASVHA